MDSKNIKSLIGVFSGSLALMGLIVPVSVLGSIAQAFPHVPIATIQLVVTLPSLLAVPTNILVSRLASKVHKRTLMIVFTVLNLCAGTMPIYLHGSITELLVSAGLVGVAMGGLQNPMTSIITDLFEGEKRFTVLGFLPTFICGGGMIYTSLASVFGATDWTHAFYAYFVMVIFLVLEIVFLPVTPLEPEMPAGNRVSVPREVAILCLFNFLLCTICQIFNSNESMLVIQRGMGGTVEAGIASVAYTVAGIVSGALPTPLLRLLKKNYPIVLLGLGLAGLLCLAFAGSIPMLCIAGFLIGASTQLFTGVVVTGATNSSAASGISFCIALGSAAGNLGQSLSPITTSLLAAPLGGDIDSVIWIGVIIGVALVTFGVVHFPRGAWLVDVKAENAE